MLDKPLKKIIEDLGYNIYKPTEEEYYTQKLDKLLKTVANENKEIDEYLSKLKCFPSIYYYSKKLGKTAEQAVEDLNYKILKKWKSSS